VTRHTPAIMLALVEYAQMCGTVTIGVNIADYGRGARYLLSGPLDKLSGVEIDLLRLFATPLTDKLGQLLYGAAEAHRNETRTELPTQLGRFKAWLKVAQRDVDEIVGLNVWVGRSGMGKCFELDGVARLSELSDAVSFAWRAAQTPPPLPANWIQTVMRGRYPPSREDEELRARLVAGFVPSSIVGFVRSTAVGIAVVGLQLIYRRSPPSAAAPSSQPASTSDEYRSPLQGQLDLTSKDFKPVTMSLAQNEAITKIGLTLASPKNKYLSVTFHTSKGQTFALGGSTGVYHYVLGNGVNTAFVALNGDFGGPNGALQNLAYWCVGV